MKRILIVDDEPDFTELVQLQLESHGGFKVRPENDAKNAVRTAMEFAPDLILLDVMMPGIDGSELAGHFLNHPELSKVPIVFLTALVTSQEVGRANTAPGARMYLPKSISAEELVLRIDETLESFSKKCARLAGLA